MAALPGGEWTEQAPAPDAAALGSVRHVFTHFALHLHVVRVDEPSSDGWWQPMSGLSKAGLPTLYRKAVALALAGSPEHRKAA
jgi:A/G-specific adenine glycosylase